MTEEYDHCHSHLFTLRLWSERKGGHRTADIRGRVEHILSGDVRYVGSLPELCALLEQALNALDAADFDIDA